MNENIAAIRRESIKYECIADQVEGDARRLNIAKAITFETLAGILEDPMKRAELFSLATDKPRLKIIPENADVMKLNMSTVSNRVVILLETLYLTK